MEVKFNVGAKRHKEELVISNLPEILEQMRINQEKYRRWEPIKEGVKAFFISGGVIFLLSGGMLIPSIVTGCILGIYNYNGMKWAVS